MMENWKDVVLRAVAMCGSPAEFCRRSGLNRNAVYFVVHKQSRPTAKLALGVDRATGGKIKVSDVMPGIDPDIAAAAVKRPRRHSKPVAQAAE